MRDREVVECFAGVTAPCRQERLDSSELQATDRERVGKRMAGEHAGDLIVEYISAMRHGIGLNKILGTIHIYPTLAEANKYAAGAWKRAHAPQGLLLWVEKFHAWMRG